MATADYLFEFDEQDQPSEYVPDIVVGGSLNLFPDTATRIAIALERIAAALERAYPADAGERPGENERGS